MALVLRKGHPYLIKMNRFVMISQYCIFMMILFLIFVVVSVVLIPFAWIVGIIDKLSAKNANTDKMDEICKYLFIPFGPIILFLDLLADLSYFWKNNFRTDLKKNIIVKGDSKLNHHSIKEIDSYSLKMGTHGIKSVNTGYLIRHFRTRFNCL